MKKRILILSAAIVFAVGAANAQTFKMPQNVKMEKESDYAKYEKDVIACVNWLEKTPIDKDSDKRKEAAAFLMNWIQGSPDVTINVREFIGPLMEVAPSDMLVIFMGGWTKYALERKNADETEGSLAGLQSIIRFYESNKSITRTIALDELVRVNKDGRLKAWLADKMKG